MSQKKTPARLLVGAAGLLLAMSVSLQAAGAVASDPLADRADAPAPVVERGFEPVLTPSAVVLPVEPQSRSGAGDAVVPVEVPSRSEPIIVRGNDRVLAPVRPAARAAIDPSRQIELKFDQAPIAQVVTAVLEDLLRADYVIHPPLQGTLTLFTQGPIPADQAMQVLESALLANGLVLAADSRGTYHVGKAESLRGIVPPPRRAGAGPLPPGSGVTVVPLAYVGAAEMAEILRPVISPESLLRVDPVRNLLILAGSRSQVEGWLELVRIFDVDLLKGMSVGVFPLRYASVREVDAALKLISTGAASAPAAASGGTPAGGEAGGGQVPQVPFRVLPIERLNSILVVSARADHIDQVRHWIERFDQPGSSENEPRLFVYPVQNGSAAHLAAVLNGIFGGESSTSERPAADAGVAPGRGMLSAATGFGAGAQGAGGLGAMGQSLAGGVQGGAQGNAEPAVSNIAAAPGIRIIADERNNAILVWSTPLHFTKIESSLKRLDLAPTQVMIEASIIEVSLNDDLKYGLQWMFNGGLGDGYSGTGVLSGSGGGVLGGAESGFSYTVANPLGNVRAVLNALAEKSLVKVISSPSLMVLDNHTAAIAVGDQQPVRSSTTVTDGGTTVSSIEYKDTGVALAVTPSVNAGNTVTMTIEQSVTDVGQVDTATSQRSFLQRQIRSKVAVRSGETLVLGGLIRDNNTQGRSGVPLLQDIPLVGGLFSTTTRDNARTELLVVITPRVLRSDQDVRDVGEELRARMQGLSGLMQR